MIYDEAAHVAVHPISSDGGMLQFPWRTVAGKVYHGRRADAGNSSENVEN